jgi:thioredoxin reductase
MKEQISKMKAWLMPNMHEPANTLGHRWHSQRIVDVEDIIVHEVRSLTTDDGDEIYERDIVIVAKGDMKFDLTLESDSPEAILIKT